MAEQVFGAPQSAVFLAGFSLGPGECWIFGITVELPGHSRPDKYHVDVGFPDPDDTEGAAVPVGSFLDDADILAKREGGEGSLCDIAEGLATFRCVDAFQANLVLVRANPDGEGVPVSDRHDLALKLRSGDSGEETKQEPDRSGNRQRTTPTHEPE